MVTIQHYIYRQLNEISLTRVSKTVYHDNEDYCRIL